MGENEKKFGDVIRNARLMNNFTVAMVAEKVGVSDRYIQKIENEGKIPSYKTLKKIVNVLSVDVNELYYDVYKVEDPLYDYLCRKLKKCDTYKLNVIKSTLNALLNQKEKQ